MVDKASQQRSHIAQKLNVRQRSRLASSLAEALLDGLSKRPARCLDLTDSTMLLIIPMVLADAPWLGRISLLPEEHPNDFRNLHIYLGVLEAFQSLALSPT